MKLSQYAKQLGISYRTAWNHFKQGKIPNAYKLDSGTIIVPESTEIQKNYGVILYARTSSSQNKKLLQSQVERLEFYAISKGYKIKQIVKEFGSGLNDNRPKLVKILNDDKYDKIIVEHKDRLTRFGFNWFQILTNNRIEVINISKQKDEDLTHDLISIIHSFSARLYGKRRSDRLNINLKNNQIEFVQNGKTSD